MLSKLRGLIREMLALPEAFRINFLSLKFEKNLESQFQNEYFEGLITHIRFSIIISIFFYAIFGVLDSFIIPELLNAFLFIRFAIVIPVAVCIMILSLFNIFRKIYLPLLSFLVFISGFGIVAMIYMGKDYSSSLVQTSYYTGLVLVFIFGYNFLKLRFWWASLAGWMIVICFEIVILFILDLSLNYIIITNFFLVSANIMGMFSSYFYELTLRMNFYHKNLLDEEKVKVENNNLQLEERVYQRTIELEKATEKAIKSDKLKSMFLANISHEIRTPMNGILGFTSLLENENLSPEKRKSYLEVINGRGKYLLNILNNLIEISMIESNSMKVYYDDVNLDSTINNLYKFLDGFFRDKELQFVTELPKSKTELIIRTDKGKLEQIITNLVTNASKYTSEGKVSLGYKIEKKQLRIFVSDNGPGIPEHFRPYIFNSFAKNENKDEKFTNGTGLGLAISKGLAELMNANLSYITKMGAGTTFYLDFDEDVIVG